MSVNKVILVGYLGADPDIKQFDNGDMIASVSVATSERWTDKQTGERREQTEWHRVVFNGRLAEIAQQYLNKGSHVYVEGKITTRKWTDKKDGIERYSTDIKASTLTMLGSKNTSNTQQTQNYQQQPAHNQAPQRTQQAAPGSHVQPYNPPVQYGNHSAPPVQAQYTQGVRDDDMPF